MWYIHTRRYNSSTEKEETTEEAPAEGGEAAESTDDFGGEEGGDDFGSEEGADDFDGGDTGSEEGGESSEGNEESSSEGESSKGGESSEGGEESNEEEAPADETKSEAFNKFSRKGQYLNEKSDYIIGKLWNSRYDLLEEGIMTAVRAKIRQKIEAAKKQIREAARNK